MKEQIINVQYAIDGKMEVIPTKMVYEKSNDPNKESKIRIHFELEYKNIELSSAPHDVMEFAIISLQKALPEDINIACCQSCMHGNFCPFGDQENEAFCLKHLKPKNARDIVAFFDDYDYIRFRKKLLDYCSEYRPIDEQECYTYNSWSYWLANK